MSVLIAPGYKVGRLTVRELVVEGNANQRRWLCDCDCGGTKITSEDKPMMDGIMRKNETMAEHKRRRWYCPRCDRYMRFPRPATDIVAYATTGRVYKCWWCYMEVYRKDFIEERDE